MRRAYALRQWFAGSLLALVFTAAAPAHAALRVFACEPEWGALATEIGGERVQVYTATSAHQDPHHIDARPSLIAQVRKADLVACTGADLEVGWLPVLLARAANPALKDDRLFYAAEKTGRIGVTAGPVDRSKGDVHAAGNPHVHLDPRRMVTIGQALAKTLATLDPAGRTAYESNAARFTSAMHASIADWERQAAPLRGKAVVVYHDAWPYLVEWLGMVQVATLEPLPGVPPSSQHLASVAKTAQARGAYAVLHTTYDDRKAVAWIAGHGGRCAIELPWTVGSDARTGTLAAFYADVVQRLARGCP